jgi:hypothetical protein
MIGIVAQYRDWLTATRYSRGELEAERVLWNIDSAFVIPAQAGIQTEALDSRLRGNDMKSQS